PPRGRKFRPTTCYLGDCAADQFDKRAGLGEKDVSVRRVPFYAEMPTLRRRTGTRLDQRLERRLGLAIVEPNVEARAGLRRYDVYGLVAHVDRREFQV